MDMNDRQLRFIVDGLGGKVDGTPARTALTLRWPARSRPSAHHQHLRFERLYPASCAPTTYDGKAGDCR